MFWVLVIGVGITSASTDILAPAQQLNDAKTIDEKFQILWNTSFVKNLTRRNELFGTEKSNSLLYWLTPYDRTDKYELVNMFEKMLLIINKMKNWMRIDDVRKEVLEKELSLRKKLDAQVAKKTKIDLIEANLTDGDNISNNYFVFLYFFFDIDWQEKYNSTSFSPTKQLFTDYYFSSKTMTILKSSLTIEDKLNKIDYRVPGKDYFFLPEKNLMMQMYRKYLENGTI